jgi:hypothetical protein
MHGKVLSAPRPAPPRPTARAPTAAAAATTTMETRVARAYNDNVECASIHPPSPRSTTLRLRRSIRPPTPRPQRMIAEDVAPVAALTYVCMRVVVSFRPLLVAGLRTPGAQAQRSSDPAAAAAMHHAALPKHSATSTVATTPPCTTHAHERAMHSGLKISRKMRRSKFMRRSLRFV